MKNALELNSMLFATEDSSQTGVELVVNKVKKNVVVFPVTCQETRGPLVLWSYIAHLSAMVMLKSAVIEEKKSKHSPWAGVDNPLGPKFLCQQEGLITMVICCKFKKNLLNLWFYTHLFMI